MAVLAHQRTIDELGTPLIDTEFCVIDLETTGTNRHDDMITEIGAVRLCAGECTGTFQTLINPGRAIPPQITVLTGLSDALVASAPRIESVLAPLLEFIGTAVIVAHNASFDLGFINAALERSGRDRLTGPVIDTVALSRRLLRSEVPNCRLGTLAERFGLAHRPSHRALDDALATGDLLHLLIERASALGVHGCDDLMELGRIGRHPQAAKLKLTDDLPRRPGIYQFHDARGDVLYVGKATNLRQRVRGYFGSDDRRKIGPLLRELTSISSIETPDPITAEVLETRLINHYLPRYNRVGTRSKKYCYLRLDHQSAWPRLAIVREPSPAGIHLGPIRSRRQAQLAIEALQSVVGLRRCSVRLSRSHIANPDAIPCSAAQLGVAACPCAGLADTAEYRRHVEITAGALKGTISGIVTQLSERMAELAIQQRFEEAAEVRDRADALATAVARQQLTDALRAAGRIEITDHQTIWTIDGARLIDARLDGQLITSLPIDPPEATALDEPLRRSGFDEALILARFIQSNHERLEVLTVTGRWNFPVATTDRLPNLDRLGDTAILGLDSETASARTDGVGDLHEALEYPARSAAVDALSRD